MLIEQRQKGRQILISEIRRAGSIPRIDLAELTGISRATVTTITAELIQCGLIEEIPVQPNGSDLKRGRPRVDLKIRGDAFIIVGMKVNEKSISIVFVDFEGKLLSNYVEPIDINSLNCDDLIMLISTTLDKAAQKTNIKVSDIKAVGIGLAGIMDVVTGVVHWSPILKEREVALQQLLSNALHCPAFIDNDANLVAKAEQHFGHGKKVRDFLVITIESGVGLGIVLNNELYRGTRGCGAEFGHIKVQLDGALCRCGQRGCLEAYVADYALLKESIIGLDKHSKLSQQEQLEALVNKAKEGEITARSILDRAERMFTMGLANLVNIFDPQLIILAGQNMQLDYLNPEGIIAHIKDSVVQVDASPPEIIIHKWDNSMWARGAAAYAIEGVQKNTLEAFNEDTI